MATSILLLHGGTHAEPWLRMAVTRLGSSIGESVPYRDAAGAFRRRTPALVLISCHADHAEGALAAARALRAADARLPIVLVAHASSEALAVGAIKAGVSDYVKAPADDATLAALLARWLPTGTPPPAATGPPVMVGMSGAMRQIHAQLETVGASDTNVLITGETGTGKELVAQLLHAFSPRRHRTFVSINCAAIPDSLMESELFGYERGAFTGAHMSHDGHLRAADGGTVLFDEIGDMSPYAQAKILRALDAREVYRLGSTKRLPLNIRVIAATNQDLALLVDEGRFRKDLYYRLNVVRVRLPPLRERREDIAAIISYYIVELNERYRRAVVGFCAEAVQQLLAYDWPGNVRELRNVLEGAYAELPAGPVTFLETPTVLRERLRHTQPVLHAERDRLLAVLIETNWNKSRAAEQLHWSRMTLYRKLAKYALQQPSRSG